MSGQRYILIRDDDVSFFTRPQVLQRVHGPLFSGRLPLNLAVIPNVRGDIRGTNANRIYLREEGLEYEPFIPPHMRGKAESFPVGRNGELCNFIRANPQIEVVQHGYSHEWAGGTAECAGRYSKELAAQLRVGRKIIQRETRQDTRFFVPPWDALSRDLVETIREVFDGVSMKDASREMLPFGQRLFARRPRLSKRCLLSGDFLCVGHPGYIVSRFNQHDDMRRGVMDIVAAERVVVLVTHHWEFFFDWGAADEALLKAWHEILEELIARPDVEFLTFSHLYSLLKDEAG